MKECMTGVSGVTDTWALNKGYITIIVVTNTYLSEAPRKINETGSNRGSSHIPREDRCGYSRFGAGGTDSEGYKRHLR